MESVGSNVLMINANAIEIYGIISV